MDYTVDEVVETLRKLADKGVSFDIDLKYSEIQHLRQAADFIRDAASEVNRVRS